MFMAPLRFTLASRTDLRVRLLHLGSPHLRPKGYSLCKGPVSILSPLFLFVEIANLSTTPLSQEGGVFSAKLTFVRGAFRP
jgi:hypothetical protein